MKLSILELSIYPLVKIIFMFILIMISLPIIFSFDQRKMPFLKSVFRYLVQGIFLIIISSYLLTMVKLFEFFSLVGVYLFICYAVVKKRRKNMVSIPVKLLDVIENEKSHKHILSQFWTKLKTRFSTFVGKITIEIIVVFVLLLIMIIIRFTVRIVNPMAMASMADPYVHLTWAKMMQSNLLFTDGLYPMGYHGIIASLGTIANVDIYHVVRFMGPIGSSILVVGFYWFIKSITKKPLIAIIGTIAFGLSTYNGLPLEFFRQTLSLSMEFSMSFILPGLVFLHDYIKEGDKRDLVLFGITVVVVVMVHSYGALFFAIGTVALLVSGLINRCLDFKKIFWILVTGLSGGLLGMMPIIVGRLQGIDWHIMSTSWIESNMRIGSWQEIYTGFSQLIAGSPIWIKLPGLLVVSVLFLVSVRNVVTAKKEKRLWEATSLIMMITVAILYYGPANGFSLLDYTRVTMFLTISILIGAILCFNQIVEFIIFLVHKYSKKLFAGIEILRMKKVASVAFVFVFTLSWIIAFPIQLTASDEMAMRPIEYNSAVGIYFQVKRDYPLFNWTLVAPVEQYQEALGYGFHYELWEFVEDFSLDDAKDPNFDIPIPTGYIFIYVEKVPLRIWTNHELDATQERFRGPTETYYRDADNRAKLEESIWIWCETYMKTHDNMTEYYEDDVLKVYKVEHDPTKFIVMNDH